MRIDINHILVTGLFLMCCTFFSCDDKYDNEMLYETPDFKSSQNEFADEELLSATYSEFKFPSNFYNENLEDTSLYYVNTVSIDSSQNGEWIQLSTNSVEKAKSWSIRSTYENSYFEDGIKSEKFFEFIRITNPKDNSVIKFRTHNSSYLTRENYHLLNKSDTIGVFRKQGFTVDEAKELIDYLWFIKSYNNNSSKILSSFAVNNQQTIEIHHYELYIVYGDFNLYDKITLLRKIYKIDKNSGVITISGTEIRTINGKYN